MTVGRRTKHYLNLNYICNEHCVFCASDLTNNVRVPRVQKELTLEQIRVWIARRPPHRNDEVLLAGGEPTLHRQLFGIVSEFAAHCRDITLFTNGVRLAEPAYARDAIAAGVSTFEIALFGATPETHEAVTRRRGSFHQTMAALNNLVEARRGRRVSVVVRLLVASQSYQHLPDIVRAVHEGAPGVDRFSVNRLILSENALGARAMVAWPQAAEAINEAARLVLQYGYELCYWPVPLCVFRDENAVFVEDEVRRYARAGSVQSKLRYLDPLVASGTAVGTTSHGRRALPDVCRSCRYVSVCGGIEDWYYERFGTTGLGLSAQ